MSLREDASYVFGPAMAKFIPKNSDGSTPLPYPGKTEVVAFSGLGPFDFSGAGDPSAVPLSIKINDTVETKSLDFVTPPVADINNVTVTEFIAAVVAAAFTGITPTVDSRGYAEILVTAGDGETDYIQVYGEAGLLAEFGYGYGLQFINMDTQQTFPFTPTNVDDDVVEVIDSNGKITSVVTPGYRSGVTASLVDTAVDDTLRALLTGGSYDTVNKIYVAPLPDDFRPLLSIEVVNKIYLKDQNQDDDYIGVKITRAFNMSSKETSSGDGGRNFQTMGYDFNGVPYTDPETKVKYGDSLTREYTKAEYNALKYGDI